jgi:small subunit ribosomal protein S9
MTTKSTAKGQYQEAIGRRKTAIARVRITPASGDASVVVNQKPVAKYFVLPKLAEKAVAALQQVNMKDKYQVSAKVVGGGINAQAEAVRLGIARALVKSDDGFHKTLRIVGLLTRDSRKVERKKYGFRKSRRAPQWAKR